MKKVSLEKKYKTRTGAPVQIFMINAGGLYPVIGAIQCVDRGNWRPECWTEYGSIYSTEDEKDVSEHVYDLVEEVPVHTVWVNIYENDQWHHLTRESADSVPSAGKRVACIQVTYTIGEGLQNDK